MKKLFTSLLLTLILFCGVAQTASAYWVSGYYRNSGTYVDSYQRTYPRSYRWNSNNYYNNSSLRYATYNLNNTLDWTTRNTNSDHNYFMRNHYLKMSRFY